MNKGNPIMPPDTEPKYRGVNFDTPSYDLFDQFRRRYNQAENLNLKMPDMMKKAMLDMMYRYDTLVNNREGP